MSASISGTVAGEGHKAKRINQIIHIDEIITLASLLQQAYPCLSLFISYTGYCRLGCDSPTISNQNQPNQEEAQHQFLKLWLKRLYVSSLLQALRTFTLDQHLKPTTLSLSSSQASSTWCKLPHSAKRHRKMLVLISRIFQRLAAQSPSRTLLKTSYYSAYFHSRQFEGRNSGSTPTKITSTHGQNVRRLFQQSFSLQTRPMP